ncbi:MAG: hypothetical protein ACE5FT_00925 [Candidatus Nanoarchaeia archaeon]
MGVYNFSEERDEILEERRLEERNKQLAPAKTSETSRSFNNSLEGMVLGLVEGFRANYALIDPNTNRVTAPLIQLARYHIRPHDFGIEDAIEVNKTKVVMTVMAAAVDVSWFVYSGVQAFKGDVGPMNKYLAIKLGLNAIGGALYVADKVLDDD